MAIMTNSVTLRGIHKEEIILNGIGEGPERGGVHLYWLGKDVQLMNLCIESWPKHPLKDPVGDAAAKTSLQWVSLQTTQGPIFVERFGFEREIHASLASPELIQFRLLLRQIFQPVSSIPIYPSVLCSQALLLQDQFLQAFAEDVEAIAEQTVGAKGIEAAVIKRDLYSKAASAADRIAHLIENILPALQWNGSNSVKIPEIPFSTRCFKDQTGKKWIDITLGVIDLYSDKRIKSVIRIQDWEITKYIRATHRAPSSKTPLFLEEANARREEMELLAREAMVTDALIRRKVPFILPLEPLKYHKEGTEKTRFMKERFGEDLANYSYRIWESSSTDTISTESSYFRQMIYVHLQILQSLRCMHRRGLVHRDLKPENILLNDPQLRLTGFGFAQKIGEPTNASGSPMYIAPELFRGTRDIVALPAADMWAFGVMYYNCIHLVEAPFKELEIAIHQKIDSYYQTTAALAQRQREEELSFEKTGDTAGLAALKQNHSRDLMKVENQCRLEANAAYHKLIVGIEELRARLSRGTHRVFILIRDLLSVDPSERPTAEQALGRLEYIYQRPGDLPLQIAHWSE
jgi:hypothetical protein